MEKNNILNSVAVFIKDKNSKKTWVAGKDFVNYAGPYFDENEIVFYEHGNLSDLKNKIDKYLLDGVSRETIRLNGHERTKKEHTYVNRWASILETLNIK